MVYVKVGLKAEPTLVDEPWGNKDEFLVSAVKRMLLRKIYFMVICLKLVWSSASPRVDVECCCSRCLLGAADTACGALSTKAKKDFIYFLVSFTFYMHLFLL